MSESKVDLTFGLSRDSELPNLDHQPWNLEGSYSHAEPTNWQCYQAAHKRWVPAPLLARLLGLAAASYVAVPTARLLSRASHDVLGTLPCDSAGKRRLWHSSVRLDRPALADIRAWADFTYTHPTNGRPIWAPSSTTRTLHTDASKFAWGVVLDEWGPGRREARGYFGPEDRALHITAQEMLAVVYAVDAFAEELRGQTAAVYIDASSVEFALRRGSSRSPTLMPTVRSAWRRWADLGMSVFIRPVRSKDNPADDPSRFIDRSDWKLNSATFAALSQRWGAHSIDLFASEINAQVPRLCTPAGLHPRRSRSTLSRSRGARRSAAGSTPLGT